MNHWAADLIGLPWVYGASGPREFDCWGFVRYVQDMHYGVQIPAIAAPQSWVEAHSLIRDHSERQRWAQCAEPSDGCVVLMAKSRHPVHVGVVVLAGPTLGVLHCIQKTGVVFQALPNLASCGWGKLTYYRRKDAL